MLMLTGAWTGSAADASLATGEVAAVPEVFVDYSLVGHARRFRTRVKASVRRGLQIGDTVVVRGDDVAPADARVLGVAADVDPHSGRARLSYRQAERLFGEVDRRLDPGGAPWTLHRLRHAGIAHAVSDGWNLAQVRAKSRHSSLRSLEVYANPSAAAIRAMTDALDSDARRPHRRPAAGGAR